MSAIVCAFADRKRSPGKGFRALGRNGLLTAAVSLLVLNLLAAYKAKACAWYDKGIEPLCF